MPVLSVEKISKDFRNKPLFNDVTFGIDWSERLGLIGTNGSGKSTLMRIVAGEEIPDTGRVIIAEGSRVGYLPQNPAFDPEETVLDAIFSRSSGALSLIHDYEAACTALTSNHDDPALTKRIAELSSAIDAAGAWDIETNAKVILSKLGVTDLNAKMGHLSGGQRKRVALAHALIVEPDLLMLDEPTNHLDAETISWLEGYLSRYSGALLLVTHDRYFLDRVTEHILEIDRGTSQTFTGNYQYYLEKKEELEFNRKVEGEKRQSLIKRELAWLKRGAKARTTKQKARIDGNEPQVEQIGSGWARRVVAAEHAERGEQGCEDQAVAHQIEPEPEQSPPIAVGMPFLIVEDRRRGAGRRGRLVHRVKLLQRVAALFGFRSERHPRLGCNSPGRS